MEKCHNSLAIKLISIIFLRVNSHTFRVGVESEPEELLFSSFFCAAAAAVAAIKELHHGASSHPGTEEGQPEAQGCPQGAPPEESGENERHERQNEEKEEGKRRPRCFGAWRSREASVSSSSSSPTYYSIPEGQCILYLLFADVVNGMTADRRSVLLLLTDVLYCFLSLVQLNENTLRLSR